jgi:hypothetical protein
MTGYTYSTALIAKDQDPGINFNGTLFTGLFDGNDHTVSNLTIDAYGKNNFYLGLFGRIGEPAEITSLNLKDVNVVGDLLTKYIGGLVALTSSNTTITGCTVTGVIKGYYNQTGGLVGESNGDYISSCSSDVVVSGEFDVGGLIGNNSDCIIMDCNASGQVTGENGVGGLIGRNQASVTNCHADSIVSGTPAISVSSGGLIGHCAGSNITGCYSKGSVSGNSDVGGLIGGMNVVVLTNSWSSASVSATGYGCGGLVGWSDIGYSGEPTIISYCYATGDLDGDLFVGGLAGVNWGIIDHCYATGDVTGDQYVGGFIGNDVNPGVDFPDPNNGKITNCYSTGNVEGNGMVGGFAGELASISFTAKIDQCYSTSNVTGNVEFAGGFIGNNYGLISDSYALGTVSGDELVGGFAGRNSYWTEIDKGEIERCFSSGNVTGDLDVGGFLGAAEPGTTTTDSFWDTQTSGKLTSDGGTGKTTDEMQTQSTFTNAGWDFTTPVWEICPAPIDYPHLAWETFSCQRYSGGLGLIDNPFLIASPNDLDELGKTPGHWDVHFQLIEDINLTGYTNLNKIGNSIPFTGTFDGDSHTISNFTYSEPSEAYIGLFGYVSGSDANITNLDLDNINITGLASVGALVGNLEDGSVNNCSIQNSAVTSKPVH